MFEWLFALENSGDMCQRDMRQLMAAQSGYLLTQVAKNQEHVAKALELVKGCPPSMDLQPYIDLVAQADALGLDVIRRG